MTQQKAQTIEPQSDNDQFPERRSAQTFDQVRATFVLGKVQSLIGKDEAEEYRRIIEGLPVMVLTNGLGQTLAWLYSRPDRQSARNDAMAAVTDHLEELLVKERAIYLQNNQRLIELVITGNRQQLRRATAETLAALSWWSKFVRAFLPKPKGGDR